MFDQLSSGTPQSVQIIAKDDPFDNISSVQGSHFGDRQTCAFGNCACPVLRRTWCGEFIPGCQDPDTCSPGNSNLRDIGRRAQDHLARPQPGPGSHEPGTFDKIAARLPNVPCGAMPFSKANVAVYASCVLLHYDTIGTVRDHSPGEYPHCLGKFYPEALGSSCRSLTHHFKRDTVGHG